MAERRTGQLNLRVSPAELAAWRAKAQAAGVPLSDLLRQAMARTRTWTAAAASTCTSSPPAATFRRARA